MASKALSFAAAIVWLQTVQFASSADAAFVPAPAITRGSSHRTQAFAVASPLSRVSPSQLYLFGRNKEEDGEEKEKKGGFFDFWNRDENEEGSDGATTTTTTIVTDGAATATTATTVAVKEAPPKTPTRDLTPEEQAARLRGEAEKARLEAERMDAELTLRKIARLEKELASAVAHKDDDSKRPGKDPAVLQRELEALLSKVRGESATGSSSSKEVISTAASDQTSKTQAKGVAPVATSADAKLLWPNFVEPFDEEEYNELKQNVEGLPKMLRATMAVQVEMRPDQVENNSTELLDRLDKMRRFDFSYSSKPPPVFSNAQIAAKAEELKKETAAGKKTSWWGDPANMSSAHRILQEDRYQSLVTDDMEELAKLILEYEYYIVSADTLEVGKELEDQFMSMAREEPWLKPFLNNGTFPTPLDSTIEGLYPKCTVKKDSTGPKQPTEAQVQQFVADILPKANFKTTAKPESVLGGYIIRGTTSFQKGDEVIDRIDKAMMGSSLQDKMTVLLTADFTLFASDDTVLEDFDESAPILYITAPDICREAKPVQLSIVTGLGIATTWYLSLYPFLLNPAIAARVDEQLALADANMTPDLAWLTDLSIPLFATFVGLQLVHELGHLVTAGANGIKTSSPTFVPSIITGITSSVTSLKSPPKNKAALFDFAISGPLAGMIASVFAIALGSQLTTVADPTMFPALPLEILRQSTLGGGIIENILGSGALGVPEGALGTAGVASMTVALHPVAIAGYISLIVNALAVLPIGTTDGGRAAIALFGRGSKILIGNIFFAAILFIGLFGGSDLFLFYFAFCIAFQGGNEVPARNEYDKVDLPRVLLATGTYVLAVLALVPFQ